MLLEILKSNKSVLLDYNDFTGLITPMGEPYHLKGFRFFHFLDFYFSELLKARFSEVVIFIMENYKKWVTMII